MWGGMFRCTQFLWNKKRERGMLRTWHVTSELELESQHENTLLIGVFCEALKYLT